MYLINSIYLATEGEGVFLGLPQIFVRYQGCNIGCHNCDSKETWDFDEETRLTLNQVLLKIQDLSNNGSIKRVSITGGDPLHPKFSLGVENLVKELKKRRYAVNIEAAGTRVPHEIFDYADFISFDVKTPSTGVITPLRNIEEVIKHYPTRTQLKSVIASKKDFDYVIGLFETLKENGFSFENISWCLTPEINPGEEFNRELFINILNWNQKAESPLRVIGQQHKWIFGPDRKNV